MREVWRDAREEGKNISIDYLGREITKLLQEETNVVIHMYIFVSLLD